VAGRPSYEKYLHLKNKNFFRKEARPRAASTIKKSRAAACPASCVQCFKTEWGGRGAGTPAPQLRLAPAKFGAGKFCRFKEQKKKIFKGKIYKHRNINNMAEEY
jgi:hypothetical protein